MLFCGIAYSVLTLMPIVHHSSRYHTPFSSKITNPPFSPLGYSEYKLGQSMVSHFEASAKRQHWKVDAWALAWTLDTLDEDHELEQFAAGIPGLFVSKAMEQPAGILASISESTTLHPNLGKDIQKLDTGSSQHAESSSIIESQTTVERLCFSQGTILHSEHHPNRSFRCDPWTREYCHTTFIS